MFDVTLTITGLQEAQAANNRLLARMQPRGALERAVLYGTTAAHRAAVVITHVDTGALRASHRMEVSGLRGRVYIDPGATNPRSGVRTAVYGPMEHARGGGHAFYRRVVDEEGQRILGRMAEIVRRG
jgi:hypothetical protein